MVTLRELQGLDPIQTNNEVVIPTLNLSTFGLDTIETALLTVIPTFTDPKDSTNTPIIPKVLNTTPKKLVFDDALGIIQLRIGNKKPLGIGPNNEVDRIEINGALFIWLNGNTTETNTTIKRYASIAEAYFNNQNLLNLPTSTIVSSKQNTFNFAVLNLGSVKNPIYFTLCSVGFTITKGRE